MRFAAVLLPALLLAACSSLPEDHAPGKVARIDAEQAAKLPPPPPPLSLDEIVARSREGMGADELVARLRASSTRHRLAAADVVSLRERGVPLAAIDYLLEAERAALLDDKAAALAHGEQACRDELRALDQRWWLRCQMSYPPFGPPYPFRRWWP